MTGYLFDTNIVSELRKKKRCAPAVRTWYDSVEAADHYLSVLVLGEVRNGIERIRHRDAVSAQALESWLSGPEQQFADRILPVTKDIADCWGRLGVTRPIPPIDGLLAATAIAPDLVLVTRNVHDVASSGPSVVNPFESR